MNSPQAGNSGNFGNNFLVRRIYNLVFPFVFLLLLPAYLRRMIRRGNYRRGFGQRFGFYRPEVLARLAGGPPRIWLQAVSVGEMLIALKLADALRAQHPGLPLVLSATTTTGHRLACERADAGIEVVYTPIDLAGAVRRTFNALRPALVVIVDGGLWPNLLWEARRHGIATALVNARLSPRSERRFTRFRFMAAPMFRLLDLVCVSEPGDVARWQRLGVPIERLQHTGSIKYDDLKNREHASETTGELYAYLRGIGIGSETQILLAGSTHSGEERGMAEVFLRLRARLPDLRLVIAPRHIERAPGIRADLETLGLRVVSRTETPEKPPGDPPAQLMCDVLLLDTTGELADWYPVATVVFIGKSLAATGGQNPAEAIAAGRPVIFGPHMENFRELAAQLLASDGAVQIHDWVEFETECGRLLADPAERSRLAANGRRQLEAHRGAAGRTARLLLERENFRLVRAEDLPDSLRSLTPSSSG